MMAASMVGSWRFELTEALHAWHRQRLSRWIREEATLELALREIEHEAECAWLEVTLDGELVSHVVGDYYRSRLEPADGAGMLVRKPNGSALLKLEDRDTLLLIDARLGTLRYRRERASARSLPLTWS